MSATAAVSREPFDPALPGTPDLRWGHLLRNTPELPPIAQPVLVVSPHPDDEVLAAGGLMHLQARARGAVTVLSVTDGAAAYPDWAGLDQVRRGELRAALQILGEGKIHLESLGLTDGRVEAMRGTLYEAIGRHLARRPILVAPYEADGHPDHDVVGSVCVDLARRHSLSLLRYPVWTWHHANPATLADTRWGRVTLDAASRQIKARAVACFASQLRPAGRSPIVPAHVLEYFRRPFEAFLL